MSWNANPPPFLCVAWLSGSEQPHSVIPWLSDALSRQEPETELGYGECKLQKQWANTNCLALSCSFKKMHFYLWECRGQLQHSVLPFHHRVWTQVNSLGSQDLYLPSHLLGLNLFLSHALLQQNVYCCTFPTRSFLTLIVFYNLEIKLK